MTNQQVLTTASIYLDTLALSYLNSIFSTHQLQLQLGTMTIRLFARYWVRTGIIGLLRPNSGPESAVIQELMTLQSPVID